MLHDEREVRLSTEESSHAGELDRAIPDWDEIVLLLQTAVGEGLDESSNSHINSGWAKLIAALVEQRHSEQAKGD